MAKSKTAEVDLHYRPETVDPSEYVWCGLADHAPLKGVNFAMIRHDILARLGVETGSSDTHSLVNVPFHEHETGRPNYRCHHCHKRGSGIRYFIFFFHKPSKKVVIFGRDCAKRFNLATKTQLDIESERDQWLRLETQSRWTDTHHEEIVYLSEYNRQRQQGGKYVEFLDGLWIKLQRFGTLTEGQIDGLHRWMARGKPWETTPQHQVTPAEADAKQAVVTRANEEPTSEQVTYALKLWSELDKAGPRPYVKGMTRGEAEKLINELKAERANGPANSRQLSLINRLMDGRSMPPEKRQEARRQFDAGLTYDQASRWIERLKTLEVA